MGMLKNRSVFVFDKGEKMKLKIKNKVNSKDWLIKTSFAENEFAYKVIEDERLWNIGDWSLDYITLKDGKEEIGYCTLGYEEGLVTLYGLSILPWHRNKGHCTEFLKLIISQYKEYNITLLTRNIYLEKVLKALDFKYVGTEISEYSTLKENKYLLNA